MFRSITALHGLRSLQRLVTTQGTRALSCMASTAPSPIPPPPEDFVSRIRNIGISAHIDSGKTTLTERVLFYTDRIREINEVRGKTGKGATMDSMDLEREKGITIQSAATHTSWGGYGINIIDTPGHVDFTIEVERALRVLDGAVMVLCGVSGVQSQTMTVDRQMRRYGVPRLTFINKLDRAGSDPDRVVADIRKKLGLNAAAIQIPIGLEDSHEGVIDIVEQQQVLFSEEDQGATLLRSDIPSDFADEVEMRRMELFESLAEVDDEIAEIVLNDEEPTVDDVKAAIRRATIALQFTPVLMGSAFKNKGVQPLLDAVVEYLPNPAEVTNHALDLKDHEKPVEIDVRGDKPFLGLAFKLEDGPHGLLTYMRIYQGVMKRGDFVTNVTRDEKVKVNRLVRMHANSMEDVQQVRGGQICAMFGVECASGDTFTGDRSQWWNMTSMHVPEPVISLAIKPKNAADASKFSKGLGRFQREDPTLRIDYDDDTKETVISGMGELHLEIYVERLGREYGVECETGRPKVTYTEGIAAPDRVEFDYLHKKQSGGSGQYARVMGYVEQLNPDDLDEDEQDTPFIFEDATVGNNIPPQFIPAIERGAEEAAKHGPLTGHPVTGVRVVLTDGLAHAVDSSELAFKLASRTAIQQALLDAQPIVREPVMAVEVSAPKQFQGAVIGQINQRKGMVSNSETTGDMTVVEAKVPLNQMFGYATELRSATQGNGEFAMDYAEHVPVDRGTQEELVREYQQSGTRIVD